MASPNQQEPFTEQLDPIDECNITLDRNSPSDEYSERPQKRKRSKQQRHTNYFQSSAAKKIRHSPQLIKHAVVAVKMGASIKMASKILDIPYTALYRYIKNEESVHELEDNQTYEPDQDDSLTFSDAVNEELPTLDVKPEFEETMEPEKVPLVDPVPNHCCVCLTKDDLSPALLNQLVFLENFIDGGLRGFEYESLKICGKCTKTIRTVIDFKNTCTKSLASLESMAKVNMEPIDTILIKTEPDLLTDFVDSLEGLHDPISKRPTRTKKKSNKPKPVKLKSNAVEQQSPLFKCFCSYCSHFFSGTLEDHYVRVHSIDDESTRSCKVCESKHNTREDFLKHFNADHIRFDEPKQCTQCDQWFEYREPYKMHVSKHNSEFKCDFCNMRFYQWMIMRQHVETKHIGLLRCKLCRGSFESQEELNAHMEDENRWRKQNKCEYCNKTFIDKQSMRKHRVSSQCNKEKLTCELCGDRFVSEYAFNYHHKAKHQELQHLCTYCGMKFVLQKQLARHIAETHEADKHDPLPCDLCGKLFSSNRKLRGHITGVHAEEKYKCKLCDKKFKQKHCFERHQFSHAKTRPFNCHLCTTGYYRTDYLKGHYESVHQLSLTPEEIISVCKRTRINFDGLVEEIVNENQSNVFIC